MSSSTGEVVEAPAVRAALEHAVVLGERRVQVAAYVGDRLLVDAWIGEGDGETLYPVFSVSKAVTALAVHIQAERGLVDLDSAIARYWPEYAQQGKRSITVRHVLSHRAGVPHMPRDVTPERLGDWEWMTDRLAALEPRFPPGAVNAYHSLSFGWLLGEVVRRTDPQGRSFARFVRDEVCEPVGADSFWFGVPADAAPRVAELFFPEPPPTTAPDALVSEAVPPSVALAPPVFNRRDVQSAVVPAVGGVANACSLARIFGVLANGGSFAGARLMSAARVDGLFERRPDSEADDLTYGRPLPVGTSGLWLTAPGVAERGRVLAHPGAGGTVAWAEPDLNLAVAICHDRMFGVVAEHPFAAIAVAVRDLAESERGKPT